MRNKFIPDIEDPTNRDTVNAKLTVGERVMNKEAESLFSPMLKMMNQVGLKQRQAENAEFLERKSQIQQKSFNTGGKVGGINFSRMWDEDEFKKMWSTYSNTIGSIESNNSYDAKGGYNDHYDGRYQMGEVAKKDAGKFLGIPMKHDDKSRETFRSNPKMQDAAFKAFTIGNHRTLNNDPAYAALTPERKMEVLGYAHNQGATGAKRWLNGGEAGKDGFDTPALKYPDALRSALSDAGFGVNKRVTETHPVSNGVGASSKSSAMPLPTEGPLAEALGTSLGPGDTQSIFNIGVENARDRGMPSEDGSDFPLPEVQSYPVATDGGYAQPEIDMSVPPMATDAGVDPVYGGGYADDPTWTATGQKIGNTLLNKTNEFFLPTEDPVYGGGYDGYNKPEIDMGMPPEDGSDFPLPNAKPDYVDPVYGGGYVNDPTWTATGQKIGSTIYDKAKGLVFPENSDPLTDSMSDNSNAKPKDVSQQTTKLKEDLGLSKKPTVSEVVEKVGPSPKELENVSEEEVLKNGENASKKQFSKAKSIIKDVFGDLIDKKELARMGVLFLGSWALTRNPASALSYAGQDYLERIDTKTAARTKHIHDLTKSGKFNTESIGRYKETLNPADLVPINKPLKRTGETQTFYNRKTNKKIVAEKIDMGDAGSRWQSQDGSFLDTRAFTSDPAEVRGTREYKARIKEDISFYGGTFKDIQNRINTNNVDTGKDGSKKQNYYTDLTPNTAGSQVSEWAMDNNVDPDVANRIMESAYRDAIADARSGGYRVRDITPYLNEQYVYAETGSSELFKTSSGSSVDAGDADKLFNTLSSLAKDTNPEKYSDKSRNQIVSEVVRAARPTWEQLSEDQREQYVRMAGDDQSPFMVFLSTQVTAALTKEG